MLVEARARSKKRYTKKNILCYYQLLLTPLLCIIPFLSFTIFSKVDEKFRPTVLKCASTQYPSSKPGQEFKLWFSTHLVLVEARVRSNVPSEGISATQDVELCACAVRLKRRRRHWLPRMRCELTHTRVLNCRLGEPHTAPADIGLGVCEGYSHIYDIFNIMQLNFV